MSDLGHSDHPCGDVGLRSPENYLFLRRLIDNAHGEQRDEIGIDEKLDVLSCPLSSDASRRTQESFFNR